MFKRGDFTQEEYNILELIQSNQDLLQKIMQALTDATSNFDASIIVKELFNSYYPQTPDDYIDWEAISLHIKEYQMHVSSMQIYSIPREPDKYIETPEWQPSEEPLTIPETFPEEAPVEPEREPERVPEKVGIQLMPCPRNIPIEPDKYIETPEWQPAEEPLTIPETFPEEAPVEPEREPERVPEKVGADESGKIDYAYSNEAPIAYKIVKVDRDGTLISPSQGTKWPVGQPLIAPGFKEQDYANGKKGVRNNIGIHVVLEGHWDELYDYIDHSSVLLKVECYNGLAVEHDSKGLAGACLPIEVIGIDKDLLFKVKNKYGISATNVNEGAGKTVIYDGAHFKVYGSDNAGVYKGFNFGGGRGYRYDHKPIYEFKADDTGEVFATMQVSLSNHEVFDITEGETESNIDITKAMHEFVTTYLEKGGDTYAYTQEYIMNLGEIETEYKLANYRDSETIDDWEELLKIWKKLQDYGAEEYTEYYDQEDSDMEWELDEKPDAYGIYGWHEVRYYVAPTKIDFDRSSWFSIFEDTVDYLLSTNSYTPEDDSIARALIDVPWFLENVNEADSEGKPLQGWDGDIQSMQQWAVGWAQDRIDYTKRSGSPTEAAEEFLAAFGGSNSIPNVDPQNQGQLFNYQNPRTQWVPQFDENQQLLPDREKVNIPGQYNYYPEYPQIQEDEQLGAALGAIKEADYFYDWQGYYPDDGSLNDGVAQNGSPAPSFFNMPDRCPDCDHPAPAGHKINLDEADKDDHQKCKNCGYSYPMEYDYLQSAPTGVGERWNVLNKVSGPHAPKQFAQKAPLINGPTGEQYYQLERGMSDREYKRWSHGEIIGAGKYFTTMPRVFNVHTSLVKQTDEHTFTMQANGILGPNDFIDAAGVGFSQMAPAQQLLRGAKFEEQFYPPHIAKRVAETNLKEFPNYYDKVSSDEDKFSEVDLQNVPNGSKPIRDTTMPNRLAPSFIEVNKKRRPTPKVTIIEPSVVEIPEELHANQS